MDEKLYFLYATCYFEKKVLWPTFLEKGCPGETVANDRWGLPEIPVHYKFSPYMLCIVCPYYTKQLYLKGGNDEIK